VAEAAALDVPSAGRALARLTTGGLVEQDGSGYRLVRERFRAAFRAMERPPPATVESGMGEEADRVLGAFLRDGKLVSIPAVRSKRLVVLDFLSSQFEPGKVYPEAEINARLAAYHPDVASLRRYLVDEDFMERRDGFYWRSGGTFEV
jgi:hypothetical protein